MYLSTRMWTMRNEGEKHDTLVKDTPMRDGLSPRVSLKGKTFWGAAIACGDVIFAFSSLSDTTVGGLAQDVPWVSLRAGHVLGFGVLALLIQPLLVYHRVLARPYRSLAILIFVTAFAATDEIHQSFVPGRHPAWLDLGYDALGALIGVLTWELVILGKRHLVSRQ